MPPLTVSCPACQKVLRLPVEAPTPRVRCPKCKEVFEPVLEVENADSESVAVVVDPDPPGLKPTVPLPIGAGGESRKLPRRERRTREVPHDAIDSNSSGPGIALAIIAGIALALFCGLAGAGYLAYSILKEDDAEDSPPIVERPQLPTPADPKPPARAAVPRTADARIKAATVRVRAHTADNQFASASGFFVPGPGLIVTNAQAVGQGKKPTAVSKIQVFFGSRTLAAWVIGADADLDLALLQVVSLDLPEPLPLTAETFTVKEPLPVVIYTMPAGEAASAVANPVHVSGTKVVAGTRPWFILGGEVPTGSWGSPVTDSAGKLIGVGGVIPDSRTVAAVPIETVLAFVQKAVQSGEENGPAALAALPPPSKLTEDFDDPRQGNPFRNGRRPVQPRPAFPQIQPFPQPDVVRPAFPQIRPIPQPAIPLDPFPRPVPLPAPGMRGRPNGPALPKVTFPTVEPLPIRPAPLANDRIEVNLPGEVMDACTGGGGRFWFLSIPSKRQIAVFDTNTASIVQSLAVGENVKFAAGMDALLVAAANGRVTRFDLKTFAGKDVGLLPIDGTLQEMAMGSASGGPLLVTFSHTDNLRPGAGGRVRETPSYAIIDANTLAELTPGPRNGLAFTNRNGVDQLRASPDGRTIASFGGHAAIWHAYTLKEDGAAFRSYADPHALAIPAEDGSILTANGVYPPFLGLPLHKDLFPQLRVPSASGPFYLAIVPEQAERVPGFNRNPVFDGPQKITLNAIGTARPLLTLPDPGIRIPVQFGERGPRLASDRRVFFSPAARLIGLIPAGDKLVLIRFDPVKAIEKAGADYLYVDSKPPLVEPGKPFRYPLSVKSKAGGVRVQLQQGPAEMRIEGTTLVWDVPPRPARSENVRLSITDAGNQSLNHAFVLHIKD